ncbi:hypothetical protein QBC33DRAFT_563291 [Phialemonium atrogriseum]|uniref:Uncharacterized protein n=1 Tax=Phialemonium atrogriseum TaxID=1093897 RepID=A0AAJ0BRG1_9PEZI|nr:uncharacterized protein QBC33DRAFT_563291 [Phialemonium atrogriseum]KAK1762880.1 hypothetical protein QBC33DRAFT_563291 [Phialemonium atrogriseum]
MQITTLLAAAACLAAGVEARLAALGLPATIRPGDVFEARGQQGITNDAYAGGTGGYPGNIGTVFIGQTDLTGEYSPSSPLSRVTSLQGYNGSPPGPATIQAVILQFNGVFNQASLQTFWWDVTVGDETSEGRVYAQLGDANARFCGLEWRGGVFGSSRLASLILAMT